MIWHPLLLAVWVLDLLSLLLVLAAFRTAMRMALEEASPAVANRRIQREIAAETAADRARWAYALFAMANVALIIGITNVLPAIVPGAFCGTGVLQASGGSGQRALALRFVAIVFMFVGRVLEKLNRPRPDATLTRLNARMLLLCAPLLLLAVGDTFRAILRVDVGRPVDCCAVVYDQLRSLAETQSAAGIADSYWLWAFGCSSVMLLGCGIWSWKSRSCAWTRIGGGLSLVAWSWVAVAALTLAKVFSAHYYQVLHPRCLWCLFLPRCQFIGFVLCGLLVMVAWEGAAAGIAAMVAKHLPDLQQRAEERGRMAGLRLSLAAAAFLCLTGVPPIVWGVRYGVWIGG
ncbi:MAG: hypothetical protein JSW39_03710 [Desulfobacterales bacterium]|nr:MAG: hypothetical protein JSW39_03710 [Desulfobacterales bacterium]